MKSSRRNVRNAIARAERRAGGPPVQSAYALKVRKQLDVVTSPPADRVPARTNPEQPE